MLAAPAYAQGNIGATQQPAAPAEPPLLDIGLELSAGYTDNVFATRNGEVDDYLATLKPTARLTLRDGPDRLILRGEGELGRFLDMDSENYDDWLIGLDGRLRASDEFTLLGGGEYRWEHEGRASPDAEAGIEPSRFRQLYLYGGAITQIDRVFFRPAVQFNRYDYRDVATDSGEINNDDRDREQLEVGARLGIAIEDGTDLFVQGAVDRRQYDSREDDFGFRRSSHGGSIVGGVRKDFSAALSAEIFAGYLAQDYDDPRFADVHTFDLGALVNWRGPSGLAATFRLDRSVEETTLPGASSYLLTAGSITLSAVPGPRLQAGLTLAGSKYDYRGDPRSEFVASGDLWLRYWLNPHVYAGPSYSLSQRTSNAAGLDFDENRLLFRLGAELRPHYARDAADLRFAGTLPAGLYAGILGGHGMLVTGLDGPRGQGSNTADFGDGGPFGGAMLGYGVTFGSAYLGVELDGVLGGPDWLHVADRVFSVRRKNSLGVSGRIGWVSPSTDLVYGRFGISSTALKTDYTHSENVFADTDRYAGLGFGVGAEAATARRGFLRAEYIVTSYQDVDIPTGNDRFDNLSTSEGQFRIGAGLRFGRMAERTDATVETRFDGAYVGFLVGHGGLVSRNIGVRSGGTAVDIQRAGLGPVAGVLAGFGVKWDSLYLGAEADAEISGIDWNIERDPNGRVYSAERQFSVGVSGRAGWAISRSALIYGRIGPVWSRFRIPYATSGDSVLSKRARAGLRIGGGLELGISRHGRFRVEYSASKYDSYDVDYGESNSDRFRHRDNIARVGLAWGL